MELSQNVNTSFNLAAMLLRECEAMARFAFRNGKQVPGDIAETLQTFAATEAASAQTSSAFAGSTTSGTAILARAPSATLDIKQLASVHDRLTQIVSPASPITIKLFEEQTLNGNWRRFLGPVPIVRRMMVLAGFFLLMDIIISLSPNVGEGTAGADMFASSGWTLFLNELFLLSSAGLGATFAALFQINRYIVTTTYDPKYEPCYWIKFVLGVIAGFMLSEMMDVHTNSSPGGALTRPVLAMVGGFSATVVYRILTRLTETVESLFQGDTKELLASREQAAKTRLTQQLNEDRLKLAAGLIDLQKLAVTSGATGELKDKLDKVLADLIPIQIGTSGTATSTPAAISTTNPTISTAPAPVATG